LKLRLGLAYFRKVRDGRWTVAAKLVINCGVLKTSITLADCT